MTGGWTARCSVLDLILERRDIRHGIHDHHCITPTTAPHSGTIRHGIRGHSGITPDNGPPSRREPSGAPYKAAEPP